MPRPHPHYYSEAFEYLRTVPPPQEEAGLLVFGRQDPRVAHTAGEAVLDGIGSFVVISGGIGKDSGNLQEPEALYLERELLTAYPTLPVPVFTETQASNGGENVRNSLDLMDKHGLPYQDSLTGVAHATSARRLLEMMRHEAIQRNTPIKHIGGIATAYAFDGGNPHDRKEAVAEILRLADWPGKGWLQPIDDLPANLVDFARNHQQASR